jgi:D-tyrosyl-tRNA(Tyr) deacylase
MRVIVQRVKEASVSVDGKVVGAIKDGYMLLVGFTHTDTIENINNMVKKVINLRIMDDENGVMNKSILDIGGEILSISQFTLYGDARKGNRPSYILALKGEEATILYDKFNDELSKYIHVEKGIFGANMQVSLVNDGPTTILLEK